MRSAVLLLTVLSVAVFALGFGIALRNPTRAATPRKPVQVRSSPAPFPASPSAVVTEPRPSPTSRVATETRPSPSPTVAPVAASSPVAMHPPPPRRAARAAIIIDDCGNNWTHAEGFVRAPAPITLAILPHLPYTRQIAREANGAGKGVMLHFPMQAVGPINPGPGTLREGMSDAETQSLIRENLEAVPYLQGVNNHEGSRITADEHALAMVMKAVQERGLFYVDSMTTADSRGSAVAARLGLRFAERDVFLDNVDDVDAIKAQIRVLIEEARERGTALGIGHARPNTLNAFLEMIPAFAESDVTLVLASDLVTVR